MFNLTEPWKASPQWRATESGQLLFNRQAGANLPVSHSEAYMCRHCIKQPCLAQPVAHRVSIMMHLTLRSQCRAQHWDVLEWLLFINLHADLFVGQLWGDKDTFELAFHLAGKAHNFIQCPYPVRSALQAEVIQVGERLTVAEALALRTSHRRLAGATEHAIPLPAWSCVFPARSCLSAHCQAAILPCRRTTAAGIVPQLFKEAAAGGRSSCIAPWRDSQSIMSLTGIE